MSVQYSSQRAVLSLSWIMHHLKSLHSACAHYRRSKHPHSCRSSSSSSSSSSSGSESGSSASLSSSSSSSSSSQGGSPPQNAAARYVIQDLQKHVLAQVHINYIPSPNPRNVPLLGASYSVCAACRPAKSGEKDARAASRRARSPSQSPRALKRTRISPVRYSM